MRPRVLYGPAVLSCTQSDVQALERLQRDIMKRIQSLPNSTAAVAATLLLDIEQELYLRKLSILCNILYTDDIHEQNIARRQISVKDADSHSWFSSCKQLLHKYGLPNIYTLQLQFRC